MLAVAEALGPTISAIAPALEVEPRRTLSKIRRDTRFARDKSLFRDSVWIAFKKKMGLSRHKITTHDDGECWPWEATGWRDIGF